MRYIYILFFICLFTSCNLNYLDYNNKLYDLLSSKNLDQNFFLKNADVLYKQKKYYEAIKLYNLILKKFDNLKLNIKNNIKYKIAMSYFFIKKYNIAILHFIDLNKSLNKSEKDLNKAEKALYLSGYCYYLLSPNYYLDQKITYKALEIFELFKLKYPKSKYINIVNYLLNKLNKKIEIKNFKIAIYFYKVNRYQEAIIFLKNFIKDFPYSSLKEEAFFYMIISQFKLSSNSTNKIIKKKLLEEANIMYNKFIQDFPKSIYIEKAYKIYKNENL
ncbi:MAG: tetratricopeptide repeat protein [Candidatus Bostrichicola ureolyticus]|nr:MAG: tetratricopeptide repeat protein [Candidatus Bostrichicola ureolyticus]